MIPETPTQTPTSRQTPLESQTGPEHGATDNPLDLRARAVDTTDVHFAYLEFGDPAGEPVFILHGFPDNPAAWLPVLQRLPQAAAGSGVRLVVPWLRGFGATRVVRAEAQAGQAAALGADVIALADALGLNRFALIGHDWGASATYAAAVLAPERVRAICTLSSNYFPGGGEPMSPDQIRAYWYQWYFNTDVGVKGFAHDPIAFCRELWTTWSPTWRFTDEEFDAAAADWQDPAFVPTVLHYYRTRHKSDPSTPYYAGGQARFNERPALRCPGVFLYGVDDNCTRPWSLQGQAALYPAGYEQVDIAGAGHFPHREQPAATAAALARFLREHVTSGS